MNHRNDRATTISPANLILCASGYNESVRDAPIAAARIPRPDWDVV